MASYATRRSFLQGASALAIASAFVSPFEAQVSRFTSRIGLQLYTVAADLARDPSGTLKRVASVGYKNVELPPLLKMPTNEIKTLLADNGLSNPSGHYMLFELLPDPQKKIDMAKELGQKFMVITLPWVADPSRFKTKPGSDPTSGFIEVMRSFSLDDWKWNADQFNRIGEIVKKAGLELAYHNHNFEFRPMGNTTGYDEFLRLTDADLVKLELDCGWMVVAGHDPLKYLQKYPHRYRLLHIKDFQKGFHISTVLGIPSQAPTPTELGRGAIDYKPILAAAAKTSVEYLFVEQEPSTKGMPALDSIKVDYDYLSVLVR